MTKDQAISVLMLMAALASYIEPTETTKKFDKLRTRIRKGIANLHKINKGEYDRLSIGSNEVWEQIKEEIANDHFTVSISIALLSLYAFIERTQYAELFFSKRVFFEALGSIQHADRKEFEASDALKVERDTNRLADAFARVLNIPKPNKLGFLKLKIKNEMLLNNVEYKERVA